MLAINIIIFVLPITFAGLMHFPGGQIDADTFLLTPDGAQPGGVGVVRLHRRLVAATGMVIVETIADTLLPAERRKVCKGNRSIGRAARCRQAGGPAGWCGGT